MATTHAIILAAGYGSRLQPEEGHKLLAPIGQTPLLCHHLRHFQQLGVRRVTIVTGYEADDLVKTSRQLAEDFAIDVGFAYNPDFDSQNGLSVLAGVDAFEGDHPFWLTMSDHLFDPALFDHLRDFDQRRPDHWQGALWVDRKLDTIFDMPDATKVCLEGDQFRISKQLSDFDAVDVGLFWCAQGFVDALRKELAHRGDCSTSDAVTRLVAQDTMGFPDVGPHLWQDVDTPQARQHAQQLWESHFRHHLTRSTA